MLALAAAASLAAGCGSDDGADDTIADATGPVVSGEVVDGDADLGFPVTIEHKNGSTTIDAEPTRVVSVGFNDQDALLALGVTPIGIRDWYGDQPYGTWPWAQDELGDAEPELLSPNGAELNVEAVHPEFVGATSAVAFSFEGAPGAYASSDVRSRLLTDLGFVIPPEFDEIAGDSFFASFSDEQLELLDLDTVVWIVGDELALDAILELPLRQSLGLATEGREVFADFELSGAFSFSSPLSIPYLLDELVPKLAAAVDGDPTTAVPDQDINL